MTKEQIKNEAVEYAKGKHGGESAKMWAIAQIHAGRDGFIAGADWRINSVWHNPEEVPEVYATLLVKCIEGYRAWALWPTHVRDWRSLVETKRVVCWAYIDDLIPTEDERDS